jgi:cytoskeleton protein RodZ
MEEIGNTLREARERLGLTLAEAERATKIRARHLESLEAGDLASLPSPVQARGFLKNYAEFLGLNSDALLLRYAVDLQARRPRASQSAARATPVVRPVVRSRRPRWLSSDLLVAASVSLTVIIVLVWGLGRVLAAVRGGDATPTTAPETAVQSPSPSPDQVVQTLPPASPLPAAGPVEAPSTPMVAPEVIPGAGVDLRLLVVHSAWVRVVADGREAFQGRVSPGELLEYVAEQVIEVTTGNGAGLRVYFNGEDQGALGGLGEVVIRLWTRDGPATPTPTQTRTPTATPRVTPTPSAPAGPGG